MENWLELFEKKHQLNFFEQDIKSKEYNIAIFENADKYTWRVKINHNLKIIYIWEYSHKDGVHSEKDIYSLVDEYNEKKINSIVNDLLGYSSRWAEIGLDTDKYPCGYSILEIDYRASPFQIKYGVKESFNAFGRRDWSEF